MGPDPSRYIEVYIQMAWKLKLNCLGKWRKLVGTGERGEQQGVVGSSAPDVPAWESWGTL